MAHVAFTVLNELYINYRNPWYVMRSPWYGESWGYYRYDHIAYTSLKSDNFPGEMFVYYYWDGSCARAYVWHKLQFVDSWTHFALPTPVCAYG